MQISQKLVDLGFVASEVPQGAHVCQIYTDGEERDRALLRFLTAGLLAGENVACFTDKLEDTQIRSWLDTEGLFYDKERSLGHIAHSGSESTYFADGRFDPERILAMLCQFYDTAVA